MNQRSIRRLAPVVLLGFLLSGCSAMQQTYEENPKAVLGSLIGAGAGVGIAALAGGGTGAMVGAALGGALVGGYIGHRLDNRDKQMAAQAAQLAFERNRNGQPSVWNNPDSGNSGSITPTKTYQLANGEYCRMYTQTINIGGEPQQTSGTACRQADGTWKIQS